MTEYPFASRWFDVGGHRMHYVDEGPRDGEVVLCLHGEPTWGYLFRHLVHALAGTHRVIGLATIYFTDEARKQIGFTLLIAPAHRRQGFGTEAAFAVMAFAFDGLNLHRVVASCDSRNLAARGMLEKIGMRREGEALESLFQKGEWVNETWYALLHREHAATPQ